MGKVAFFASSTALSLRRSPKKGWLELWEEEEEGKTKLWRPFQSGEGRRGKVRTFSAGA